MATQRFPMGSPFLDQPESEPSPAPTEAQQKMYVAQKVLSADQALGELKDFTGFTDQNYRTLREIVSLFAAQYNASIPAAQAYLAEQREAFETALLSLRGKLGVAANTQLTTLEEFMRELLPMG